MHVEDIELINFRNYAHQQVQFSPGTNILFGHNAQGKTNLLEALHFLATGRSHRLVRDQELVRQGATTMRVRCSIQRRHGRQSLEVSMGEDGRKSVVINGLPERRVATLVGRLAAVFFSPDDLQLVKGPAGNRRRFLDVELSQVSPTYLHHLQRYTRILRQRNALLREIAARQTDPGLLDVWDEQLVATGTQIIDRRKRAVARLAGYAQRQHGLLTGGQERLDVTYTSPVLAGKSADDEESIARRLVTQLAEQRRDELRRATTLVGPHRDDLSIAINGDDARTFASQGQQRTVVLSLKLAELQFMTDEIGEAPVLLLDDVVSELDPERRKHLLDCVRSGVQTLITCTDLADLAVREWQTETHRYRVAEGTIQPA